MSLPKTEYDAVVVGSGPNGLAAAIALQQNGLSVLLVEGKKVTGGGLSTQQLTLPGFLHDTCSAIHPLAAVSPFLKTLPLHEHGLEFIYPSVAAAHPFDDGHAAVLTGSVKKTARLLGADEESYLKLMSEVVDDWKEIDADVLAPLHFPQHPVSMARFGLKAMTSAQQLAKRFKTKEAKGLWAGMAVHSIQPLTNLTTSAIALVLMAAGHLRGWPIPAGGAHSIAKALSSYFTSIGGEIQTGLYIHSLKQLPSAHAVLFDVTPRQLLEIAGLNFSAFYKWQLRRFQYGMGVFKIDWALNEPIPFTATACRQAGTIHLGNTLEEITASECETSNGKHPERPFVLLSQQSVFDNSRAPAGKHVGWAYCHVPNGSTKDMTTAIENQVERFAPGFRDTILEKHVMNTVDMQAHNPNYIGGDINGGRIDITQLFTRPALRFSPYRTSSKGIYLCSSSTPPGGGVHGMCGYHAAKQVLKDIFKIKSIQLNGNIGKAARLFAS
jgi:phytoene dehydrogenase-like protein